MQNAVSAGQVPGIEHELPHPDFFCLSLHAQVEKRLLSVDIDRLSPKPELSKGESGLSQSSGSYRKMKEIASQEGICPTSWKERWGRIWGVAHHGASWATQTPGVGQSIPVRGCSHLSAVAARQRGRNLEPMQLTACFIKPVGERQTATSFIQSRQLRHDQAPRRTHY